MRTTVTIDDHLLDEVKELAARDHRTVSDIVSDALRAILSRVALGAEEQGHHIELPTFGHAGDKPLVDILDKDALADAMGDSEAPYHAF